MAVELSIGDFSRITQLSVKTLRHYHDVGLLRPRRVDPATGYRYYSHEQIPSAQVVRRLRNLDMPVADIKAVLVAAPEARNQLIDAHLSRLEAKLASTRDAVNALRDILIRPEVTPTVEYRTAPATSAIGVQQIVDRDDLQVWWQGALGELHATVTAQHLHQIGPSGGLFDTEIFHQDRGLATVVVPVDASNRTIGRITNLVIPPAELAIMPHHGSLADIDVTWGQLGSFATRHEISVEGPLREYYVCDQFETPDATRWHTDIGWPIFRSDRSDSR
ncbi:MerR family transcriptional regulator [Prescottella agglutinans]|uniref:DNA-binding transcriptional MerR regulator n=1 Tax=Prescottella agglutinans TaxID=1644129 RepID=A0ABT6MG86_9NOCA|nr:MerR family transcriptional regulator [Prescottella agglutinans]MDH6283335.1 DNA-binding transcriptional MerR regulator [Prescottella agglutinans]